MVINLANPSKAEEEAIESPVDSLAAERESEPRDEQADVSRSKETDFDENDVESGESEVSVDEASRVVATEIYSNGLHHREIAEKYNVEMRAVKWLMKERGIGFARRDMGEPPRVIKESIVMLVGDTSAK